MSINGPEELAGMRAAGAIVCLMLSAIKARCGQELPRRN